VFEFDAVENKKSKKRLNLIETFKNINGKYSINSKSFLIKFYEGGRREKLFKKRSRLDVRKFSFSNRVKLYI